MKFKNFRIPVISLVIVISLVLIGGVYHTEASQNPTANQTEACGSCHSILFEHWSKSAHGRASVDEDFLALWDGADQSCLQCHTTGFDPNTETWEHNNVYCVTCHDPESEDHPNEIMPTDVSSRNCGECHVETFADWEMSSHSNVTLNCNNCHNPHTTSLKLDNAQVLCLSCHEELDHSFSLTTHADQGLFCVDCHLGVEDTTDIGNGHSKRSHTFIVETKTCTNCHDQDESGAIIGTGDNGPTNPIGGNQVQSTPTPVGPLGYALLASLVGIAAGIILAPWATRWLKEQKQVNL